jgi:transposase
MSEMKELLEINREILKWIKFTSFQKVKTVLEQTLSDNERKLVYHLSDGTNTREVIAKLTPVSEGTISNWWRTWVKQGIIDSISVKGGGSRGKKIFNLEDFDISIPKIPEKKKPTVEERML